MASDDDYYTQFCHDCMRPHNVPDGNRCCHPTRGVTIGNTSNTEVLPKRSIFQIYWKTDICTDFLFLIWCFLCFLYFEFLVYYNLPKIQSKKYKKHQIMYIKSLISMLSNSKNINTVQISVFQKIRKNTPFM